MLAGMMDYRNSMKKQKMNQHKIDPGTFSFMQPGWWAFHAAAIGTLWVAASRTSRRRDNI